MIHFKFLAYTKRGTKGNSFVPFCFIALFVPFSLLAQLSKTPPQVYDTFDSIVGEQNMELYNGPLFRELATGGSDSHAYFLESGFLMGDIVFDEQPYFDQNVKYNVHLDEILVTPKYNPTGLLVRLVKSKVKAFVIRQHQFVRLPSEVQGSESYGYVEVLAEQRGNMLLKKYRKKSVESRKESRVVIEFEESKEYILLMDGELLEANSKSQWNRAFSDKKKELGNFFKQNRIAFRKDKDTFFRLLFNKLANPAEL